MQVWTWFHLLYLGRLCAYLVSLFYRFVTLTIYATRKVILWNHDFFDSLHEHLEGWLQYICYRALKLQYQTNFLYRLKQYLHIFYCEQNWPRNMTLCKFQNINVYYHYFLTASSIVVECWRRVRVSGSIPSQGPRHTNDVIKMVAKAVVQHCYPWWRPRWSP